MGLQSQMGDILYIQTQNILLSFRTPHLQLMDRLAGYFHWNDKQNLDQALMIARKHPIKILEIEAWSKKEGELAKFKHFQKRLYDEK